MFSYTSTSTKNSGTPRAAHIALARLKYHPGSYTLTGIGIVLASFFVTLILLGVQAIGPTYNRSSNLLYSKTDALTYITPQTPLAPGEASRPRASLSPSAIPSASAAGSVAASEQPSMDAVVSASAASSPNPYPAGYNHAEQETQAANTLRALHEYLTGSSRSSDIRSVWEVWHIPIGLSGTQRYYSDMLTLPQDSSLFPYEVTGSYPTSRYEVLIPDRDPNHLLPATVNIGDTLMLHDPEAYNTYLTQHPESTTISDELFAQLRHEYKVVGTYHLPQTFSDRYGLFVGTDSYSMKDPVAYYGISLSMVALSLNSGMDSAAISRINQGMSSIMPDTTIFDGNNHFISYSQMELDSQARGLMLYGSFGAGALIFGLITLLVACFMIASTFQTLLAQRSREFALLRTLGADQKSLVEMVLIEALLLGVLASGLGVGAAYALAAWVPSWDPRVVTSLSPLAGVVIFPVLVGSVVLAALRPARAAASLSPVEGTKEHSAKAPGKLSRIFLILVGLGAAVSFIVSRVIARANPTALPAQLPNNLSILWGAVSLLLLIVLIFMAARYILPVINRLWQMIPGIGMGAPALLVRSQMASQRDRQLGAGRALLLGAMLVSLVLTGRSMVMATVDNIQRTNPEMSASFGYQVTDSPGTDVQSYRASLQERERQADAFADSARAIEGVNAVAALRPVAYVPSKIYDAAGYDYMPLPVYALSREQMRALFPGASASPAEGQALLAASSYQPLTPVQELTVRGSRSEQKFTVIRDSQVLFDEPSLIITPESARTLSGDDYVTFEPEQLGLDNSSARYPTTIRVVVRVATTLSPEEESRVVDQLDAIRGKGYWFNSRIGMPGQNRASGVREQTQQSLDQGALIALVLLAIATLIALLSIINTMMLSVHQRRAEYGLLRALGLRASSLMRMVLVEALCISLSAVTLGLLAGTVIAAGALRTIISTSLPVVYALPWSDYLLVLGLGVLIALLSAAEPMRMALKLTPIDALQDTKA
ncbi:MAG: FtsX-like permease family protein [Rothia sp. (in: high G+C Gram-positive bacteria)]|uniref:ABC transporter permease n=1 Tax=Rothia sp. (in: high G+C Gram-positive bacteria) TaxID=1885016 RepID=UPI0026DEB963|nr:FtsX-like permease family protein [Rothia sp. (in: high G+C Gram-positive bacteria)]MDO5750996.1 FtsX-like permease family protein [Rothia sp. (in: high G+C Gram-positive bacteria)]